MKEGTTVSSIRRDLFSAGLYKRSQGRIARQVTFFVFVVAMCLGAWSLKRFLTDRVDPWIQMASSSALVVIGIWLSFRAVNMPRFADFLIAVEAEMNKVSWPSRSELVRSSLVVMFTMFGLAATLFAYDFVWQLLLHALGVLKSGE